MPLPFGRPTLTSAARASMVDEQKRKEREAAAKDQTGRPLASKVYGISVRRIDARTTNYNALQKEKWDVREDQGISRGVEVRVGETGTRNVSTSRMSGSVKDGKDVTGKSSSGATGTSSKGNSGFPSRKIQNPTASVPDPYGYARISASQARLYRDNLDFYQNKIYSKPTPGHTIEEMLKWKGNYSMLERNHRYIQWLFPIPEGNGLNLYAQQLYEHEAQAIRDDNAAHKRVLKAYKMMLDFYGMQLADSVRGSVKRANKGWEEQYCHLNRSRHNFLRITRILKSIGELGFERLQAPWVDFLIEEAVVKKVLPNLNGPCLMHWIMAVKDDGEREMLYRKASGLPINQDTATYDMNSESDDSDEEGEEVRTKGLDPNGTEISRLTLERSENKETANDSRLLKHVDTATAVLKQQMKGEEVVNASSDAKQNDANSVEPYSLKGETLAKTKFISSSEYVDHASASGLKQKHNTPNEKSVKDKIDRTSTEVMKSTTSGSESSGKKAPTEPVFPSANLDFYQNNLLSKPAPGYVIETILKYEGQYDFFDEYPGFIHWLFPIPESTGRNPEAQPLYEHEAKAIRADNELSLRVLKAFKLMLDFYGMCLCDDVQGKFKRNKKTFTKRYDYLQRYPNNYMRITRILISLGELGYERFQVPWIDFLIEEGIDNAMFPTLDGQCIHHWINAIKEDDERYVMFQKYRGLAGHKAQIVGGDDGDDMEVDDADVVQNTGSIFPYHSPADFASAERTGLFHPLSDV